MLAGILQESFEYKREGGNIQQHVSSKCPAFLEQAGCFKKKTIISEVIS